MAKTEMRFDVHKTDPRPPSPLQAYFTAGKVRTTMRVKCDADIQPNIDGRRYNSAICHGNRNDAHVKRCSPCIVCLKWCRSRLWSHLVRHVIDNDRGSCPSVVHGRQTPVPFLSSRIPDFEFYSGIIELHLLRQERGWNGDDARGMKNRVRPDGNHSKASM